MSPDPGDAPGGAGDQGDAGGGTMRTDTGLRFVFEGQEARVVLARPAGRPDGPPAVEVLGPRGPLGRLSADCPGAAAPPGDGFYLRDWGGHGALAAAAVRAGLVRFLDGVPPAVSGRIGDVRACRLATRAEAARAQGRGTPG